MSTTARATGFMRTISLIVACLILVGSSSAQQLDPPEWPDPPYTLLIVGTFHFKDAGRDDYKPEFDVDVLSPERQRELEELLELLAAYQPTKVAIEQLPSEQGSLDQEYAAFRSGTLELPANEIYQLGFRLADRVGHERLYAVDAKRRFYEPWVDPDEWAKEHGQMDRLDLGLTALYTRWYRYRDWLKTQMTLREYLLYLNEPASTLRSHGRYLIDNFEVGDQDEFPGVDSKTAWYNRNLKIFANLQRIADREGDRLLLIIGHGHVAILRHAAQASPQFELIEVGDVLGTDP